MSAWTQFRAIGLPRCKETVGSGETFAQCNRLILPWQPWVCDIEAWPVHHDCWHRHVSEMYVWNLQDEADRPLEGDPDYHWSSYDDCDFCHTTTVSGFTEPAEVTA